MLRPKKNSCKEFDNEKKFLQLENSPPPPHNFSNGPSLSGAIKLLSVHFSKGNLSISKLQGLDYYFFPENFRCKLTYTKVRHFLIQISIAFLHPKNYRFPFLYKKEKRTNLGS